MLATNEKSEIFGFGRPIEVIKNARSLSADLLLVEIFNKVKVFAGGAVQPAIRMPKSDRL